MKEGETKQTLHDGGEALALTFQSKLTDLYSASYRSEMSTGHSEQRSANKKI